MQQTLAQQRVSALFRLAKQRASATLRPSHFLRGPRETKAVPRDLSTMYSLFRVLAAFVVGSLLATPSQAARVGILSNALAAQTAADYAVKIPGNTYTAIDVSVTVPSLDFLVSNFDVLLLFEDSVFANATAVGNRVAEFANNGHAVVLGTFYDQDRSDALSGTAFALPWAVPGSSSSSPVLRICRRG